MRRYVLLSITSLVLLLPAASWAQLEPEKWRVEALSGYLTQGEVADASFAWDFTNFGGAADTRTGGFLDVDPALWFGLRATRRLNERLSVNASWMNSKAKYRVQFPAEASVEGNFDLEGMLLATSDFGSQQTGTGRAESAMSQAITNLLLVSATFEWTALERWAYPYVSLGGGVWDQYSDGDVIQFEYETDVPANVQDAESFGINTVEQQGLSVFTVDQRNPVVSIGAGCRVSLGNKWGVDVQVEDVVRLGTDYEYLNDVSTPPPDPTQGRFFQTEFQGKSGVVHNFGFRIGIAYAVWPYGRPR